MLRRFAIQPLSCSTIDDVRSKRPTHRSCGRLDTLARRCLDNQRLERPGVILETGCTLGGSAPVLCATESGTRPLRIHDPLRVDGEVALAHIDVDRYEPVLTSLERIASRLVACSSLGIDHHPARAGCRSAVEEYFTCRPGDDDRYRRAGALVLTRKVPGSWAGRGSS
jgi:hypothetical protein